MDLLKNINAYIFLFFTLILILVNKNDFLEKKMKNLFV